MNTTSCQSVLVIALERFKSESDDSLWSGESDQTTPHSPEEEKLIKLLNVILLVNTRGGFLNFKLDCCLS